MKKGHPFVFKFMPDKSKNVYLKKGEPIVIDGETETIHSIVSVANEGPYIHVFGLLAKREGE